MGKSNEDVNRMQQDNTQNMETETTEKTENTKSPSLSAATEEKQSKPKKTKKSDKPTFGEIIADYRAEFKKIVWPSRKDLAKQTVTVIFTSILVGLIIFCMDTVYTTGYDFILGLLG